MHNEFTAIIEQDGDWFGSAVNLAGKCAVRRQSARAIAKASLDQAITIGNIEGGSPWRGGGCGVRCHDTGIKAGNQHWRVAGRNDQFKQAVLQVTTGEICENNVCVVAPGSKICRDGTNQTDHHIGGVAAGQEGSDHRGCAEPR